jgi:hypothetical protein
MVQTRLHKHSLSKKEQAVSGVASRASVRDPIDEFQDVYGSRAASAAFRQQIGSDFSRSGQIQPPIQAKPSFRGLSQELAAESQSVQLREDENKTGLPDDLKAGVESLSGFSLDDVRVHYNSSKPAQLQALAYTQGTEIHVGPGQEKHLAHEAWHVVQQRQERVKPNTQIKGINVNDDEGLEKEADEMGAKALSTSAAEFLPVSTQCKETWATAIVQRVSVLREKVKSAIYMLGYGWTLGSDERTMSVWQIAENDDWDFHFTAMYDPTGYNMTKCHFTIRRKTGQKGDDAFAWFDVEGHNKTATCGTRENAGKVMYWQADSEEFNLVSEEIRGDFANIDDWANTIVTTSASFCK